MNSALWAAKTGLDAQNTRMTTISHNLANANTTGFKKDRAVFEDLLYQNQGQVGAADLAGHGLAHRHQHRYRRAHRGHREELHAGQLDNTGNALDVAINGRGFFQVLMPDGSLAYTRDGSLQAEPGRRTGQRQRLPHPAGDLDPAGRAEHHHCRRRHRQRAAAGQAAPTQIGTLQLTDFVNPAGLQPRGDNLVVESAASGPAQTGNPGLNGLGTLQQGFLEGSNVNVVEELVNMIETQRAYEMNSKAISTTDQMLQYVSNNL